MEIPLFTGCYENMKKKQYVKATCGGASIILIYHVYLVTNAIFTAYPEHVLQEVTKTGTPEPKQVFLVDTPTCKIPRLSPFDASIIQYLKPGKMVICDKFLPYTYEDGTRLVVNWTAINQSRHKNKFKSCKYQPILRPFEAENHNYFDYGDYSATFDISIEVPFEFVRVRCHNKFGGRIYTNYHQFIYRKKVVEQVKSAAFEKHKTASSEQLNILMLGVDSVSRLNFQRYMKKTYKLLHSELGAFDMMGYNKVADNTFVNIVPMTLGKFLEEVPWNESMSDIPFDDYDFIWKQFSHCGYRTLYAEDAPKIAIFDFLKAGFQKSPADYFNRHFSIAMTRDKKLWYNDHKCLVNKLETDIMLNYTFQFASVMKNNPYFIFAFITGLTHDSQESAAIADYPYYNYLKTLYDSNMLNNTLVLFYSDHGMRFGKMRETYIGKLEERLPFLFMVVPQWFRKKYPTISKNLRINERRLITPFDVYETLRHVLFFQKEKKHMSELANSRGVSLFEEVPENRTCSEVGILPHWCTCSKHQHIQTNVIKIRDLADYIVRKLNKILKEYSECSQLSLQTVLNATKILPYDEILRFKKSKNDVINRKVTYGDKVNSFVHYQLIIQTIPGQGRFEATIKHDEYHDVAKIASDISRVNLYGDQSNCITDHSIKKFCFCKNKIK